MIEIPKTVSPLYFGGGVRIIDREEKDNKFGIRIPAGIECWLQNESFRIFAEIVPILELAPDTELNFEFGVGIRYFF